MIVVARTINAEKSPVNINDVYQGLLSLRGYFNDMAKQIYNLDQQHNRPNPDRIVISASETAEEKSYYFPLNRAFAPLDEDKHKVIFNATQSDVSFAEFSTFLRRHQIRDVALFQRGSSAKVWLAQNDSDELFAIRIPYRRAGQARINTPLVVQPLATMEMNRSDPAAGKIEILPYRPVLPHRGFGALDPKKPGHDHAIHGEFAVVSQNGFRHETDMPDYEAGLEALVTTLRLAGFKIQAARDIAVSPEGWPVFVDPDTLQPGRVTVEEAYENLMRYMQESNLLLWDESCHDHFTGEEDEMDLSP